FAQRSIERESQPNEREGSVQSLSVESDLEITAFQTFADDVFFLVRGGGGIRGVRTTIPEHDGSATVFSVRNRTFEGVVVDRVILDLHCEALDRRIQARAFGYGPAFHHSVKLQAQIEVEIARGVLLYDETQTSWPRGSRCRFARWLASPPEITLPTILGELRARLHGARPR